MNSAHRRLVRTLAALVLLLVLVVALDSFPRTVTLPPLPAFMMQHKRFPAPDESAEETQAALLSPETGSPTETEPPASEPSPSETESAPDTEPPPPETAAVEIPDAPDDETLALTFLGACAPGSPLGSRAFGSYNAQAAQNGAGYSLSRLAELLETDDISITANTAVLSDTLDFTRSMACAGPAGNADVYADASVELVSLAGFSYEADAEAALADTRRALDDRSVRWSPDASRADFEMKGFRVAVICAYLTRISGRSTEISLIRQAARESDYVVVCFRSEADDGSLAQEWLSAILRAYANAGASLIVGLGGVMRPTVTVGGTMIAYSLGTLLDGGTVTGGDAAALLRLSLHREANGRVEPTLTWIPCYTRRAGAWLPSVMPEGEEKEQVLRYLEGQADSPYLPS